LKARRTLGLYAFLYAALHFLIFVGLDYTFNLSLIWSGITEKRFVLAGLAAFILLSLLALTSFTWWQKRMGKRWKQLHRLVYLAGILVIVHYIWLVKADIRPPLLFGALLLVLLALRLPAVRKRVANWRSSLR
jgi:sulfoxide reductase heme-binding subunit YedZ